MNDHDRDDVVDNKSPEPGYVSAPDDLIELRSPSSREQLRKQLMAEVEEFLARGGKIQQVEPVAQAEARQAAAGRGD